MPRYKPRTPIPTYRPDNLLTLTGFIKYCRNRGIKTDKSELEFLDKVNLVTPAVVIYRPIVKAPNDEGGSAYGAGSIGFRKSTQSFSYFGYYAKGLKVDDDAKYWTVKDYDYYQPAHKPFVPWGEFGIGRICRAQYKKDLGKPAEPYYSPEQIGVLALVQQTMSLKVKCEGLLRTGAEWNRASKVIRGLVSEDDQSLKRAIEKRYKAIGVYYDAEDLWFEAVRNKVDWFDVESMDPADFESTMEVWHKERGPKKIQALLDEHGLTKNELRSLAEVFIHAGFNIDPNIEIWEHYRSMVSTSWIQKQKGAALLCEDYYRIARRLLWLLQPEKDSLRSIADYYSTRGIRVGVYCFICNGRIRKEKSGGRIQKTCGAKKCQSELEKRHKRNKRKRR